MGQKGHGSDATSSMGDIRKTTMTEGLVTDHISFDFLKTVPS